MSDEIYYATALKEYESDTTNPGLKAKAYVMANGVEDKIKIEYIKLRVAQLKDFNKDESLQSWYSRTSNTERGWYFGLSIILIFFFGIGLIPLALLIWLAANEPKELARQAQKADLERQAGTQNSEPS